MPSSAMNVCSVPFGADVDELKVSTITVDEGPSLKRMHARAKGRGSRILKRTSHITVVVGDAAGH